MARPARRLALIVLVLLGAALPAWAGDRALIDFIGYSPDGRRFAFEEYGEEDGSGFSYSDIYVIDLQADKWVSGSPFHAEGSDAQPDRTLAEVRAEAKGKAGGKLKETGIAVPVEFLASLGDGVAGTDGKVLGFSDPACCGPLQQGPDRYKLTLETFPADSPEDCVSFIGDKARGFALVFDDGQSKRDLHRDVKLPKSRGCPLDYRVYAVVQPFEQTGSRVAIISSYPFAFEGPSRRFIAVPID